MNSDDISAVRGGRAGHTTCMTASTTHLDSVAPLMIIVRHIFTRLQETKMSTRYLYAAIAAAWPGA
jgi:hypothetical protein